MPVAIKSKKFTFSYFKKIRNLDDMNAYISARLPLLGTGSSRKVYAHSAGKVIKMAINDNGLLQNAAELETYTNPKTKNIVTKIFAYGQHPDDASKITWLVSEGAQPIKSKNSFRALSGGIDWDLYQELITSHGKCMIHPDGNKNPENIEEALEKELEWRLQYFNNVCAEEDMEWYQKQKDKLAMLLKADLYSGVIACMQNSQLMPGDILEIDHYGKTADGKLVLIDYGLTKSVAEKMFNVASDEESNKEYQYPDAKNKTILPPPSLSDSEEYKTKKLPKISGFGIKKRVV
jgi:hypothetical protein